VGSHLCTGTFGIGSLERGDDALVIFVAGRHGEGQWLGSAAGVDGQVNQRLAA
jgi:hypothetical protein